MICISLITSGVEHLFCVPVGHVYVLFEEMFIQIRVPFLKPVLNPLSDQAWVPAPHSWVLQTVLCHQPKLTE